MGREAEADEIRPGAEVVMAETGVFGIVRDTAVRGGWFSRREKWVLVHFARGGLTWVRASALAGEPPEDAEWQGWHGFFPEDLVCIDGTSHCGEVVGWQGGDVLVHIPMLSGTHAVDPGRLRYRESLRDPGRRR